MSSVSAVRWRFFRDVVVDLLQVGGSVDPGSQLRGALGVGGGEGGGAGERGTTVLSVLQSLLGVPAAVVSPNHLRGQRQGA